MPIRPATLTAGEHRRRILRWCHRLDLTVTELACRSDMSRQAVSGFLNDKRTLGNPTCTTLEKIYTGLEKAREARRQR
jgi:transcriptional regulator with XRE-family HTH domain|tara:strand:+ start:887 stop:1120 length:234 start_codon:yes stop_codon:yes gene_type:complete